MICFDISLALHDRLQILFLSCSTMSKLSDIYSLHVLVIDEIIKLFDKSVWSLRDIVRVTDMVRLPSYLTGKRKAINNYYQNRLGAV